MGRVGAASQLMGEPALLLVEDAAAEQAVSATVELTLIEGGATGAELASAGLLAEGGVVAGEAVAGGIVAAEAGGAVVAGEVAVGGAAAAGIGGAAIATAGIALVVLAVVGIGYYLYRRSQEGEATDDKPALPRQPELVTKCSNAVSGTSASAPVMPVGLSPSEQSLWQYCEALHTEYKNAQPEAAKASAEVGKILDDISNNRPVSPQKRHEICALLAALIKRLQSLHKQRNQYIESQCDKFDWFKQGRSQAERVADHMNALDGLANQIRNAYALFKKFCGQ